MQATARKGTGFKQVHPRNAGSSYAPGAKGASVRSNKTSVGWAKKATGIREEAQTPKVCLTTPP